MLLLEYVSLKDINTLAVDVKTRFFVAVTSVNEIIEALQFAKEQSLPLFVIGGGSNIVLTKDWTGLVIHMKLRGISVLDESEDSVQISVSSGEIWHDLVVHTVSSGWYGLENLALIPGTVGAAPVQNIGAYGREVGDVIEAVEAMSVADGTVHRFTREECKFAYRHSIFYGQCPNQWIITRVELSLSKRAKSVAVYPSLVKQLQKDNIDPTMAHPTQIMNTVIKIRQSKLPDPSKTPNVGSFFKNPVVHSDVFTTLLSKYPTIVAYEVENGWKLAASWLIEYVGYKNILKDGVGTAPNNPLVLINPAGKDGIAVMSLADEIRNQVYREFQVYLEIEPLVV